MNKILTKKINSIKDTFDYSMDDGFTTIVGNKELSEGCKCCKNGEWACIFIGTQCNLNCDFCPQSRTSDNDIPKEGYVLKGDTTIKRFDFIMQNFNLYKGVSYTGGEPFLYINRILEWSNHINKNYPQIYQWVYTNGVLATEDKFKILFDSGIKEVRFDLAATNYSDSVLQKIKIARNIFPVITIEVPVITSQFQNLKSVLPKLNDIGIDHMNLHNLMLNDYVDMKVENNDIYVGIINNYKFQLSSTLLVYDMLKEISDGKYNFNAHDCTILNYNNQMIGFKYQESVIDGYKGSFSDFKSRKKTII